MKCGKACSMSGYTASFLMHSIISLFHRFSYPSTDPCCTSKFFLRQFLTIDYIFYKISMAILCAYVTATLSATVTFPHVFVPQKFRQVKFLLRPPNECHLSYLLSYFLIKGETSWSVRRFWRIFHSSCNSLGKWMHSVLAEFVIL